MTKAVKLTLLCGLTLSAVVHAEHAPKLVGEKEIMEFNKNGAYTGDRGSWTMRLSPDGRRILYVTKKTYKTARADGSRRDQQGYKFVLRDLKTAKDTVLPIPALSGVYSAKKCMAMALFDPRGKTLIVPVGQDGNKNDLIDGDEMCKPGLYDIPSEKLTTLDIEAKYILPTFHPDGKTLVVSAAGMAGAPTDSHVYITPTDKIKFRTLGKDGSIHSISPTSDLMAMLLRTEAERPRMDKLVLYDLSADTIKAELPGDNVLGIGADFMPQWTANGRYLYYLTVTKDDFLTRIWDVKAGKEVGTLSGVIPLGPGPGEGTMVLFRMIIVRGFIMGVLEGKIALHAQDNRTLGQKLHPLGDKSTRPISTQGKWLLFIREDAKGGRKACMAEIALPKK